MAEALENGEEVVEYTEYQNFCAENDAHKSAMERAKSTGGDATKDDPAAEVGATTQDDEIDPLKAIQEAMSKITERHAVTASVRDEDSVDESDVPPLEDGVLIDMLKTMAGEDTAPTTPAAVSSNGTEKSRTFITDCDVSGLDGARDSELDSDDDSYSDDDRLEQLD